MLNEWRTVLTQMKYRRLGKTGLSVSVVGLGGWQFGGEWGKSFGQDEVDNMLGRAGDLGVNFIDTAECYGDHLSERLIGNAISGARDKWIISTKFGHQFRGHLDRDSAFDVASVAQQFRRSLEALRTDYIDLLMFHSGNNAQLESQELWSFLHGEVAKGTVRHLGVSLSGQSPGVVQHQARLASALGANVIQAVYSRLRPESSAEVFPICQREGLGVVARVPLAQGLLAGRIGPDTLFESSDLRSGWTAEHLQTMRDRVERILHDELVPGTDPAQWAIGWCLRHDCVATAIVGCKSVSQVENNAVTAWSGMVSDSHPLHVTPAG